MVKRHTGIEKSKVKSIYRLIDKNRFHNRLIREGFTRTKGSSARGSHDSYKRMNGTPIVLPYNSAPHSIAYAAAKYLSITGADEYDFLMDCAPKQRHRWEKMKHQLTNIPPVEEHRRTDNNPNEQQPTIITIPSNPESKQMNDTQQTFIIKTTRVIEEEVHYQVQADNLIEAFDLAKIAADEKEDPSDVSQSIRTSISSLNVFGCEELREVA
jgi:hypothetical protein